MKNDDMRYMERQCPANGCLIVVDTEDDEQVCSECGESSTNDEFDTPPYLEGRDPLK